MTEQRWNFDDLPTRPAESGDPAGRTSEVNPTSPTIPMSVGSEPTSQTSQYVPGGADPTAVQNIPPNPAAAPNDEAALPPSIPNPGWSPLGATPSTPPTRTAQAGGPPQAGGGSTPGYLPPVAPPVAAEESTEVKKKQRSGSRWGWRAALSFLAGGLIAAAGFGAAQLEPLSSTDETQPAVVEASTGLTTETSDAPDPDLPPETVPLVPADVNEPAAFVADTLGPAVVQITTNFGVGSGVVYKDGLIITNNHVVAGATSLRVTFSDGRVLDGELLGADPNVDVAVVSVGEGQGIPIAQLATGEKPQVGQIAIAIGSPFQLQQSVTAGIVSAVDRPIFNRDSSVVAMIQTDAPINPGNSGGALADRQGRVIGINTSIQTDGTPGNVGVGFAIPIDTAVRLGDLIVAGEPIVPGFLGVRGEPTRSDQPEIGEAGVLVTEITVGSAAEVSGLLVNDRVLSVDGAPVTLLEELAGLVLANQAGDIVTLEVVRNGETIDVEVVLGEREG